MWVMLNDQAPNDPEIDALSDGAFRLWVSAMCYCQAELTDGFVGDQRVRRLTPRFKPVHLKELTKPSPNPNGPILQPVGDGYVVRNFKKYNRDAEYWNEQRRKAAERKAKWREVSQSP